MSLEYKHIREKFYMGKIILWEIYRIRLKREKKETFPLSRKWENNSFKKGAKNSFTKKKNKYTVSELFLMET